MKFYSLSTSALAAALLAGVTHAGFPDEGDGKVSRRLARMLEQGAIRNSDGTVSVLVKYKDEEGHAIADSLDRNGHGHVISERARVEVINANVEDIEELAKNPHIEMVELDQEVHALPNMRANYVDADKGRRRLQGEEETPYGILMVNPNNLQQGDNSIKICVVDTGYANGHEDLPSLNATNDGYSPYEQLWHVDGNGHGTHCAGTIGAIGGNNVGVTSVNPDPEKFSFFISKGLDDSGSGSWAGVMDAVEACVNAGAKVISMSLGGSSFSQIALDQYKGHYDNDGVLIIAAAGNGGNSGYSYPASYKYVMSVAAVDSNKNKAGFSQFNNQIEIAAPGVSVKSTLPGNAYGYLSGTSMATPHVAGVAALVWSHFPDCSNKQIREALISSAEDLGAGGCDNEYGFGLVDAKAAYDYLSNRGCGFFVGETLGGCNQCAECTSAPTSSPTAFACPGNEKYFKLSLETDYYGGDTSWKVTSPTSGDVISGSEYKGGTTYTERHCIQSDACTFEISDSYGDGICCRYGNGSYKVWVDGVEKGMGGEFDSSETVPLCAASPTPAPSSLIVGETGRIQLSSTIEDGIVADIAFRKQYINPVVVAFINTRNGDDSVSARVRAISSSGCQLFMQEPDNEGHDAEWVSYIVVESGRNTLEGGIVVEAGITSSTIIHRGGQSFTGHPVQFEEAFTNTPAILHSLMTHNNNDFMASLVTDVRADSFIVAMEAADTRKDSSGEDVGWIAFSSATGSTSSTSFTIGTANDGTNDGVDDSPHVIDLTSANFNDNPDIVVSLNGVWGVDGSWARGAGAWSKDMQHAYAEEDQIKSSEREHIDEQFAWAAFTANTDLIATASALE